MSLGLPPGSYEVKVSIGAPMMNTEAFADSLAIT